MTMNNKHCHTETPEKETNFPSVCFAFAFGSCYCCPVKSSEAPKKNLLLMCAIAEDKTKQNEQKKENQMNFLIPTEVFT